MKDRMLRALMTLAIVGTCLLTTACSSRGHDHGHTHAAYNNRHPHSTGYYRYRHHTPRHSHSYGCGHAVGYHYY